jgi:hypothetical protein
VTDLPLDATALDALVRGPENYYSWTDQKKDLLLAQARAALTLRDELAKAKKQEAAQTTSAQRAWRAAEAIRTELTECRVKLAQAEQEVEIQARCGGEADAMGERWWKQATASQARERELRGALTYISKPKRRQSDIRSVACGALARPADDAALREMLTKACEAAREEAYEVVEDDRPWDVDVPAIVSRILGGGK